MTQVPSQLEIEKSRAGRSGYRDTGREEAPGTGWGVGSEGL